MAGSGCALVMTLLPPGSTSKAPGVFVAGMLPVSDSCTSYTPETSGVSGHFLFLGMASTLTLLKGLRYALVPPLSSPSPSCVLKTRHNQFKTHFLGDSPTVPEHQWV